MTEQEWRTCTDPQPMLEFLLGRRSAAGTDMRRVAQLAAGSIARDLWRLRSLPGNADRDRRSG